VWGLKFLSAHQSVQKSLRQELYTSFKHALTQTRAPTAEEIAKARIPYLDACNEEIIRCSGNAPAAIRTAEVDTQILGYSIPKGTDVFFMANGPSMLMKGFDIDENVRSASSQAAKGRTGEWHIDDIEKFKPERWLKEIVAEDGKTETIFDPHAGPLMGFGLGPRGCWGRKLAYVELKLFWVLLLWHFELLDVPERYSGFEAMDRLTHQPQKCYVRLKMI
jgi:cytochrome P450